MMRPLSIRALMLLLAAAFLLPLGCLMAWHTYGDFRNHLDAARGSTLTLARLAAAHYDKYLHDTAALLHTLAQRPGVRALDPERCDPFLEELLPVLAPAFNLGLVDGNGDMICMVVPAPPGQTVSMKLLPSYREGREAPGLHLTEPFQGPQTGRWLVGVSYPVRGADGGIPGRVGLPVELGRFQEVLGHLELPEESELRLFSRAGALLAQLPPHPALLGSNPPGAPTAADPESQVEYTGTDGVRRISGVAPVGTSGWRVQAGVPRDAVLAPARAAAMRTVGACAGAAVLVVLFVSLLMRWTGRSAARLAALTAAAERGERAALPLEGPSDLRDATAAFNRLFEDLRVSAERLRLAGRATRDVIRDWDVRRNEVWWSGGTPQLLGLEPGQIGGGIEAWSARLHPKDQERVVSGLRAVVDGSDDTWSDEYRIRRGDETFVDVLDRVYVVRDAAGAAVRAVGAITDITLRKRAELALEAERRRLRDLIDGLGPFMFVGLTRADGTIVEVNRSALEISGLEAGEVIGRRFQDMGWWGHDEGERRTVTEAVARAAAGHGSRFDTRARVAGGRLIDIDLSVEPVRDRSGAVIFLVPSARSIAEHKRVEAELRGALDRTRALSRRLNEAHDAEQRRLSAELHDRIGQNLTALGINLDILDRTLPRRAPQEAVKRLRDSRGLLEDTIASVRDLVSELRPAVLDDYGLLAALRWYASKVQERSGIKVEVRGEDPAPRLPATVEGALFRVAQEAVTNTVKHAEARCVTVALEPSRRKVRLTVSDDGRGFDTGTPGREGHLGLTLMRERAEAVGARLGIESAPDRGTRVVVEWAA